MSYNGKCGGHYFTQLHNMHFLFLYTPPSNTKHTHTHSGQGETVISILIDLNGFWTYENREVLLAESQDTNTN